VYVWLCGEIFVRGVDLVVLDDVYDFYVVGDCGVVVVFVCC